MMQYFGKERNVRNDPWDGMGEIEQSLVDDFLID
jgi:hypothetical protein